MKNFFKLLKPRDQEKLDSYSGIQVPRDDNSLLSENLNSYSGFQVPRDENSLLSENLKNEPNRMIRLKKYVIILRRNGTESIFNEYKYFLEENLDFFLLHLGIREINTQVETYVDFGSDAEKGVALGIMNFIMHEKLALTLGSIYDFKKKKKCVILEQYSTGSFHSIRLGYDDSLINFLNRISVAYTKSYALNKMWIKILATLAADNKSTIGIIFKSMSAEMKRDYAPLIKEIMETGVLNPESQVKVKSIQALSAIWRPSFKH